MADANLAVGPPAAPETATPAPDAPQAAKPKRERKPRARTTADADRAAAFSPAPPPIAEYAPEITEARVRSILRSGSGMLGAVIGDQDVPGHWHFTADELDELVPPVTAWINRTPRLLVAAQHGDELTIMLALAQYGGRNYLDGQRAKEARRERERETQPAAPSGGGLLGLDAQRPRDGRPDDRGSDPPADGGPR